MNRFADQIERVRHVLDRHAVFLIAGHQRADGDSLGSQLALRRALLARGKTVHCYHEGPTPAPYAFLPGIEHVASTMPPSEPPVEATFLLDCSKPERAGEGFETRGVTVCIDHHQTNHSQADINLIDPGASSTGELLFGVLESLETPVDRDMATCLYTSIMTDTGSFRYSNTSARAMAICANLIERGADPAWIASSVYENRDPRVLRLEGQVLSNLRFECQGALVWAELTRTTVEALGLGGIESENLISDMRAASGVEVAAIFKQTPAGCRVSLRSKNAINVATLAQRLGGGGHRKAAGVELTGEYVAMRDRALTVIRQALHCADNTDRPQHGQG